ncbi:uncharacterized protein LOC143051163 [Mytilus galloprovincialis]|uniref:uncharacterized protein LOC143051163 n=1 Tax=Mytilus galloprovincialis TaxID=29158 RepID=UPI003F7B9A5A
MNRSILVVGVNIGKLYSGYTFSTKSDFDDNPNHVKTCRWKSEYLKKLSEETPTSILLNAEKGFESFGYEAEVQYMSLTEETKESDVYFFQHFLCQTKWYRKNGKMFVKPTNRSDPVLLKTLIKHSVSYLKKHFDLKVMKNAIIFEENEILWVVVYPDKNEFDLRFTFHEACLTAGICEENFVLIGESLAIKSFTHHIEPFKKDEIDRSLPKCTVILNCTLTQVRPNKALQIYPQVLTILIGISSVIADIETVMTKRLGCSIFNDLTDIKSRCELIYDIEEKLKSLSMKPCDSVKIRLPISVLGHMRKHITNSWKEGFRLQNDFLCIDSTVIHEVFQNALEPLLNHFKREITVLNKATIHKVILVGDFSRYIMTKLVFQDSFPQYEFIVPLNSYISATIGATIAGHEIQSDKYDSYIQYVPKMSFVGTSHIEPELLSTPSGLDDLLSEKAAAKAIINTTDETGDDSLCEEAGAKANMDTTYVTVDNLLSKKAAAKASIDTTDETVDDSLNEKAAAKTSIATSVVIDDNTNLSFLPDPIRPSKIAIKLQDLYESEYTDSLAAIEENEFDDAKSKEILLHILHEAYDECRKQAYAQINTITQLFHPTVGINDIKTSLPSDVVKPLIEYRRKNALKYLPGLIKSFVETLSNKINIANVQLSVCTSFIEKSIECCWLMCVTEPPMFLKFKWNKSEQIDLDEVEIEGGDGRYVDSMRWPTLYLYENGPLMNKGVVNAK